MFPQQLARNVTESMLDVAGTSGFALAGGRTAAAKTGTNQLGETRDNRDAWTVGYTPSLSAAVWVGTDKSDPIRTRTGKVVYGATLPGPIWQAFMNAALKGTDQDDFSPYEPMGTAGLRQQRRRVELRRAVHHGHQQPATATTVTTTTRRRTRRRSKQRQRG